MKFIRFQSLQECKGTPSKLGIFQIAFRVRDAHETSVHDANEIRRHIEWLKVHLYSPDILPNDYRAIFWFKDTAHEPMRHLWAIRPYLEAYGQFIEIVTTSEPGRIVYEDGWQIAAQPGRNRH